MKTNHHGLDIIKSFEGLRLKAYLCPAGVWTIGWGHTGDVRKGDVVTEHQAEALLDVDLDKFERGVVGLFGLYPKLNEHQFSALVSFAFNVGLHALAASKLLKYAKAGQHAKAAAEFKKWVHAKDPKTGKLVVLSGLVMRRSAESGLYLRPVTPEEK